MATSPTAPKTDQEAPVPKRIWVPALVFSAVCLVFVFVAFFVRDLSADQQRILNAIFALLGGCAAGFIGGSAFFKFTSNWNTSSGLLITGTAGIAVFLILIFFHPLYPGKNLLPLGSGIGDNNNPAQLGNFNTYHVTGTFQRGYKISPSSYVIIDSNTGLEVSANIVVLGENGEREEFEGRPAYNTYEMWQWQNQGSLGGSLDFQDNKHSFVRYSGGYLLTNSDYWNNSLKTNLNSSDTAFKFASSSNTADGAQHQGNVTSGGNSPIVTGDANQLTYGQSK